MDLADDAGLARRGGVWRDVLPGERLVGVRGRDSTIGYVRAVARAVAQSSRLERD